MNSKRFWEIVAVVILASAIIFGISRYVAQAPAPSSLEVALSSVTISIEGLYQNEPVGVSGNESVLKLLAMLNAEDPALGLETKEYSGLGTLVTAMGGLKNGTDNKYWQYKVNGVLPMVGADQYILKEVDSVEWFFATSQE